MWKKQAAWDIICRLYADLRVAPLRFAFWINFSWWKPPSEPRFRGGLRAIGAVEWSGEGWRCMGNGSGLQGGLILLWHALESFKIGSRLCFIKLSDLVIEWCRASLLKDVKLQQVVSDEYHRDRKSFPLYLKVNVGFLGGWGAVLWVYLGLGSWWWLLCIACQIKATHLPWWK